MITADMQGYYGLEADNLLLLEQRSWQWLERRITGLLSIRGRLRNILENESKEADSG
jgi:hypothetical protein